MPIHKNFDHLIINEISIFPSSRNFTDPNSLLLRKNIYNTLLNYICLQISLQNSKHERNGDINFLVHGQALNVIYITMPR